MFYAAMISCYKKGQCEVNNKKYFPTGFLMRRA